MADDAEATRNLGDSSALDPAQSMKIAEDAANQQGNDYLEEAAQSKTMMGGKFTTRSTGFVGQAPSSLAALARGKAYFIDPYTPFTPRPDTLDTRTKIAGPPLATSRSNHWITQTSQGYVPKRLQNHRVPRTPPEVKLGFPGKPMTRPAKDDGTPQYLVDEHGHLLKGNRKGGRTAFPMADEVGGASWSFSKMGYV
mmetsp:Transcript_32335/g.76822  ORF Transcript_32335/g.76822 Transcript_32335/m.76822 type:complete len:196 (-) Transcript_32335:230-817(-)|eukprot:CAMPEP_0180141426 /NCGR_PEP_ID=MMETSP0986-20121125/14892_1 /TAXON_ID=697907 /ORGANISM="non described non described, Strain CCMP2293" /LENGTH=195 /DNA_ID=CAMNT_0022084259 /DNA_START=52 /DNA_END=639 /DNA_ORIENTATION=+